MAKKDFDEITKEQFKFLESDFDFRITKCQKEDWGYELIYQNKTTAVKIIYEFQEVYIFIMLYQLVDGVLIENQINTKEGTILHGYGLDDIISYLNPPALIKPAYEYGEESEYYDKKIGLMLYVSAFANNLREYASDILSGDFKIFLQVDRVVKDRLLGRRT